MQDDRKRRSGEETGGREVVRLVEVEHRLGEPMTEVVELLSAGGLDDC